MANTNPPYPVEGLARDCILRKRLNNLAELSVNGFKLGWDPDKNQWVIKFTDTLEIYTSDGEVMVSRVGKTP